MTAYSDAPLYARTSGYVTKWYYDIGAHVKKGAVLAEIASPEVDQQVAQSEADLATAESNAGNAKKQAAVASEKNHALSAPGSSQTKHAGNVTQCLGWTSIDRNLLELVIRKERDETAVRRPEKGLCVVNAENRAEVEGVQGGAERFEACFQRRR